MVVRIFLGLPKSEKILLRQAFFGVLSARSRIGMSSAQFLSKPPMLAPVKDGRPPMSRILWAIIAVSKRTPFTSNCLVRAFAARKLLADYGYSSELRIGVAKNESGKQGIHAHAWLEKDGKILIGDDSEWPWTPLPRL